MNRRGFAARLAVAAAVALLGVLAWAAIVAAAPSNVPTISNLHAHPRTFCAKKSAKCSHPGTTIRFTVSTAARVRGDIRPRFENRGALIEFDKRFPRGTDHVRLNDSRLTKGTWVVRLQGRNSVGSGGVALIHVHVVNHD